jgi:hypothetical protein
VILSTGAGAATTDLITLRSPADITNFEVGMWLIAVDGDANELPDVADIEATPARARVGSIDRQAGTMRMVDSAGVAQDLTDWTVDDHLIREGDFTASNGALKLSGLDAWIPSTATLAATTLFGVSRAADVSRLGGIRVVGTSMTVTDALIELSTALRVEGAKPDVCFLNPVQMRNLIREMGSTVVRDVVKSPDMAQIGFEAIVLHTPAGRIKVVEDVNCPANVAYMLTMKTWKLYSMGPVPHILKYPDGDGLKWLRVATEDAVEYRVGFYGQMACNYPGANGRVSLAV